MKNLNFFKKDINNCARCGLCQAVCPVYQATKNDCTSPRGKFILINEMLKNNMKPSKKLKNYMTMCINCGKCINYCPSKIDTIKINEAFEKDYPHFEINLSGIPILIRYFLNKMYKFFEKKIFLSSDKKYIYLSEYGETDIPNALKKANCTVIECGIPIRFAIFNPIIYKELAKISAIKILEINPDNIITKSTLCITELQVGLHIIKSNKKYNIRINSKKIFTFLKKNDRIKS